jgi:hypothetical protein
VYQRVLSGIWPASSEITISTSRFRCRPAAVLFGATGYSMPYSNQDAIATAAGIGIAADDAVSFAAEPGMLQGAFDSMSLMTAAKRMGRQGGGP